MVMRGDLRRGRTLDSIENPATMTFLGGVRADVAPEWRNWQTRQLEGLVGYPCPCRFKSCLRQYIGKAKGVQKTDLLHSFCTQGADVAVTLPDGGRHGFASAEGQRLVLPVPVSAEAPHL